MLSADGTVYPLTDYIFSGNITATSGGISGNTLLALEQIDIYATSNQLIFSTGSGNFPTTLSVPLMAQRTTVYINDPTAGAVSVALSTSTSSSTAPSFTAVTLGTGSALSTYTSGGTFTPGLTLGGGATGITYGAQTGRYTQIGNIVHISGVLTLTSKGSSTGVAVITGLPVAATTTSSAGSIAAMTAFMTVTGTAVTYWVSPVASTSTMNAVVSVNGAAVRSLLDTDLANTSSWTFNGSYLV
jgi:hypothetical protein